MEVKICPEEQVGMNVESVYYSNDGGPDEVNISVDGQYVGSFRSGLTKGYGRFWGYFKSSDKVGSKITLTPGNHTIELSVVSGDKWGIELDRIVLQTDAAVDEQVFWCGEKISIKPDQTIASSSLKPPPPTITTTTSTTTTTTTTSSITTTTPAPLETGSFIEQLSLPSKCLDIPNVRVKFNPTTLKGVEIISQAAPVNTQASTVDSTTSGGDLKTCKGITAEQNQVKNIFLVRQRGLSIQGEQYQTVKNEPLKKGMSVAIDAGKENKNVAKLVITNKRRSRNRGRIWNLLTVTDEGKIYPHHENEASLTAKQSAVGDILNDISGIVFGNPDNAVKKVRITRRRSEVTIQYADGTFVRLIYRAENGRTSLIISNATVKDNSVSFISSHLNDNTAAVNQVVIDGTTTKHVMDDFRNIPGRKFLFEKTSPNPRFHASGKFQLNFP